MKGTNQKRFGQKYQRIYYLHAQINAYLTCANYLKLQTNKPNKFILHNNQLISH